MSISLTYDSLYPETVGIYLPRIYDPAERVARLEQPIAALLKADQLGIVDGGGTWFHGASDIWIFTRNTAATLLVLRRFLAHASVPQGTQIQYSETGVNLHDEIRAGEWKIARPALYHKLGLAIAA